MFTPLCRISTIRQFPPSFNQILAATLRHNGFDIRITGKPCWLGSQPKGNIKFTLEVPLGPPIRSTARNSGYRPRTTASPFHRRTRFSRPLHAREAKILTFMR